MADDSKTERATPKKRRDERKKGNVFLSKDAVAVASLFGSVIVLRVTFSSMVASVKEFMMYCIAQSAGATSFSQGFLLQCIVLVAKITGPLLAVAALLSIAATFAQTQLLVSAELLKPKFDRLSPIQGFKRLFSLRSLIDVLKNLIKISILLYMVYSSLQDMMDISMHYLYADISGACQDIFTQIFSMLLRVSLAFLAVAVLDFLYQWWDYERQMRMSKQEIKEEYKQTEGDPQVKGKIKELQRRMAQSRMMQQVPQSDVIVKNPTHIAVALRYHSQEDSAPIVLAKGMDSLAQRIITIAEENDIIVIENIPLAHALYLEAELNKPIPQDLYEAVADIMVYLYKLGRIKA